MLLITKGDEIGEVDMSGLHNGAFAAPIGRSHPSDVSDTNTYRRLAINPVYGHPCFR
jgi:hypothetical protein